MNENPFSASQWIAWIGATIAAAFTMITYAHSTFMTVREKEDILYRLERIEKKLDDVKNGISFQRRSDR